MPMFQPRELDSAQNPSAFVGLSMGCFVRQSAAVSTDVENLLLAAIRAQNEMPPVSRAWSAAFEESATILVPAESVSEMAGRHEAHLRQRLRTAVEYVDVDTPVTYDGANW